ncbi:MAG: carboxypeptidase regulatory-like domain-containing protein [Desulfococcaceae bacterium]
MKTRHLFRISLSEYQTFYIPGTMLIFFVIFILFPATALCIPPANDNFADAITLTGLSGQISGANTEATGEEGEPNHANVYDSVKTSSVWYKWEAPANATVTFHTHGSNFDTIIAVYTGSAVDSLTEVAASDDDGKTNELFSTVTFQAQSGILYRIAIDGYQTETGNFVLNWIAPSPAPDTDTWENDDSFDKANVIVIDSKAPQRHFFHDADDEDWIRIFAVPQESVLPYQIKVNNLSTETDIVIELYDTDGTTWLKTANYWTAGQGETLTWNCEQEGIYYVKVWDMNHKYGEQTPYDIRVYREIGDEAADIGGIVTNSLGIPIEHARVKIIGGASAESREYGRYDMKQQPTDNCILTAEADGYQRVEKNIKVEAGKVYPHDIIMYPNGITPGDINKDTSVSLADAIMALQITAGMTTQTPDRQANVNEKHFIGLAEAIFALRKAAGL